MGVVRHWREQRVLLRAARAEAERVRPLIIEARDELAHQAQAAQRELEELIVPQRPCCPRCGAPLVIRTAHKKGYDGRQFWGCSTYPRCNNMSELGDFPDAALAAMRRRR